MDEDLFLHHEAPFYNECRAYGRLKEADREDLAAKCYGYLLLSPKDERMLVEEWLLLDWKRESLTDHRKTDKPIQALVKEYVESDYYFSPSDTPRMKKVIRQLNLLGIQVNDVKADNWRGGALIDLSSSHTAPHFSMDPQCPSYTKARADIDFRCFDRMIREYNMNEKEHPVHVHFAPNNEYRESLRNSGDRVIDLERNVPAMYTDWKKAVEASRRRSRSSGKSSVLATAPEGPGWKAHYYSLHVERVGKQASPARRHRSLRKKVEGLFQKAKDKMKKK